jgi:hypothetical protein
MPPFSDQEAADLFRAYEAPEVLQREGPIRFFNGLAAGHPLLLAAVAEFLAKHDWQHTNQEIESLLQGAHVVDLMPEVVGRLVRTVDIQPRDLLYRLTLPIGAFKHSDVMALAGVEPPIDRPGERLNAILGAWVQRSAGTGLAVSPLVKPLGKTELSPDVRKRCYRDLALRIVKKGSINQDEGESAILYSLEAHEFRMAVRLYVSSLIEALKAREELRKYIIPTIDKWRETALPQSLDVGTRLFVRAFQLAAFTKFGLDPTFVVHDIDALLSSASERDGWSIVGLAIHSLRGFRLVDPLRVIGYVRKAIELPRVVGPDGGGFEIEGLHLPDLLWMLVADLRTPALVEAWLDVVESLTHTDQEQFWNAKLAGEGVWLVANRVYMTEWKKPKTEQDWEGLLQFHRSMLHRVRPLKRAKLEAAFSVAMLEILGDQKRIAELTGVAEPVLARWPADPDVQFRVKGSWGRQCVPMGRCDLALSLIDAALAQPHSESDHARLRCLLQANMCVAEGDLRYIEEARDLARKSVRAPKIEVARAFGEYALSRLGSAPDHARALAIYPTWSEAMRKFFELDSKNEIWRDLAILFAHVTSYLTQFASEGAPPKETI